MKPLVITGSSGLIGSEVCRYFARDGFTIHGVDNNQRAVFFGEQGDTRWNQRTLQETLSSLPATGSHLEGQPAASTDASRRSRKEIAGW